MVSFTARCYGRETDVFFDRESGERGCLRPETDIHQGRAVEPHLFTAHIIDRAAKTQEKFEAARLDKMVFADDVQVALLQVTPEQVAVVHPVKKDLAAMGVAMKEGNTVVLSPPGHGPGYAFGEYHVTKVVKEGATEARIRLLTQTPDKQAAVLTATE